MADIVSQVNQFGKTSARILENVQVRIGPDSKTIRAIRKQASDEYNSRPEIVEKREAQKIRIALKNDKNMLNWTMSKQRKGREQGKVDSLKNGQEHLPSVHDAIMREIQKMLQRKTSADSSDDQ